MVNMKDDKYITNEELVKLIQQGIDEEENLLKLFENNRSLIIKFVKPFYRGCNGYKGVPIIELEELIQESYFGIVNAAKSYRESEGVLFITYASHYIKQSARRYIENCGRMIRVPVHRQHQIHQYHRVSAYYLQNFNRKATKYDYARWLEVSVKKVEELEKYMYKDNIKSLDEPLTSGEDDQMYIADIVASDTDIENDVIEKVADEQIKNELWNIVRDVLKDDKMVNLIHYRFIDKLTLEETGERLGVPRERVRQYESKAIRKIRCNTRIKKLGIELGLLSGMKQFNDDVIDIERVKRWVINGYENILDDKELQYAKHMGWL